MNLANLKILTRRPANILEARKLLDEALKNWASTHDEDHPNIALIHVNLANSFAIEKQYDEAERFHKKALQIRERAFGASHLEVAKSLNDLAGVLRHAGRFAEARKYFERALEIKVESLSDKHPSLAKGLSNLADVHADNGDYQLAKEYYERALGILRVAHEQPHPQVGYTLNNLGTVYKEIGDLISARETFHEALLILEALHGPDHPDLVHPLRGLMEVAFTEKRYEDAVRLGERALRVRETKNLKALMATSQFALARVLWESPRNLESNRKRAQELARLAADYYRDRDADDVRLHEVETWLTEH